MPLNRKVIHVHIIGEHRDYYFGSITAVYKVFTKKDIGVGFHTLRHYGLHLGAVCATRKAIVQQGDIITTGNYADFDFPSRRRQRKPHQSHTPPEHPANPENPLTS